MYHSKQGYDLSQQFELNEHCDWSFSRYIRFARYLHFKIDSLQELKLRDSLK